MREICRNPQALTRFLALRKHEGYVIRSSAHVIWELELRPKNARRVESAFDTGETTATAKDIQERMQLQARRYWEYFANGTLTPQWRSYGQKHADEIARYASK